MKDTKITRDRIQNHFTYSWWKYALLFAVAIFGWNIIYTTTKYQAPSDRRLGIYFVTHFIGADTTDWIEQETLRRDETLEEVSCISIALGGEEDQYYADVQLSTYIAAGEGDIYIMTKEKFRNYAAMDGLIALEDLVASRTINTGDMDLSKGYVKNDETGEVELYGIPADSLYGLLEKGIDNKDLYICIMAHAKNEPAAERFINWFIQEMKAEKPEYLVLQEETEENTGEISVDIPSY